MIEWEDVIGLAVVGTLFLGVVVAVYLAFAPAHG